MGLCLALASFLASVMPTPLLHCAYFSVKNWTSETTEQRNRPPPPPHTLFFLSGICYRDIKGTDKPWAKCRECVRVCVCMNCFPTKSYNIKATETQAPSVRGSVTVRSKSISAKSRFRTRRSRNLGLYVMQEDRVSGS